MTITSFSANSTKSRKRFSAFPDSPGPTDGQIDDVRIYDRVLSKPEIQALYNLSQPSGTQVTEKQVPGQNQSGVSRYKLNGDVTDNWGSNDGTDNTTVSPSYVTGIYGQAKNFNGSSDHISTQYAADFGSNSFSVSAWVKTNVSSPSVGKDFVGNYDGSSGWLVQQYPDDIWRFYVDGSPDLRGGASKLGVWKHVVAVADSNTARLYENANTVDSAQRTGNVTSSGKLKIGARADGSGHYFDGSIDDLRIYDTALTPQQVEKLYHKGAYRIPRESTLQ